MRVRLYDRESNHLVGRIVNVSADESVLDGEGWIDPSRLKPVTYDPIHLRYLPLGEAVGKAFAEGKKLR